MRRLVFSLLPLLLLLAVVEVGACVVSRATLVSRSLPVSGIAHQPRRGAIRKHASDLDIVCAGDSWTYGWGVEPEESYPWRLARRLRKREGLDSQVINLGNPGASPIRVLRTLNSHLSEESVDLVIYLAGSNTPSNRQTQADEWSPSRHRRLSPLFRRLAAYRLLSQVLARRRLLTDSLLMETDTVEEETEQGSGTGVWWELAQKTVASNVSRLADMADVYGFDVLVLTYGLPPALESLRGASQYRFPEINEVIRSAAAENDLALLDMEAVYLDRGVEGPEVLHYGLERMSPPDLDLHPNGAGYAIFAAAISDWIAENYSGL